MKEEKEGNAQNIFQKADSYFILYTVCCYGVRWQHNETTRAHHPDQTRATVRAEAVRLDRNLVHYTTTCMAHPSNTITFPKKHKNTFSMGQPLSKKTRILGCFLSIYRPPFLLQVRSGAGERLTVSGRFGFFLLVLYFFFFFLSMFPFPSPLRFSIPFPGCACCCCCCCCCTCCAWYNCCCPSSAFCCWYTWLCCNKLTYACI